MALHSASAALLLALTLTQLHLSWCQIVRGSVSCNGCSPQLLPGVQVAVKCSKENNLAYAVTDEKGLFQAELPLSSFSTSSAPNCLAMILGGTKQLCGHKKSLVSKIVKAKNSDSYIVSTPLSVLPKCPSPPSKGSSSPGFKSSKTVDLPLPPEWGLAPTSYYINPFIPIIGIP
ncbi:hypothetical protein H6P81_003586 [Aristolochia fimbriata]|uniref:Uncharacterized protein n=1 Tax=Aristolochia fimbriata TaxID=158543 RepID=A0AAV7FH78_ARIFI|nr:hypothetical protein H6P81_003586 [Aristolochia fimbriata]